MSEYIDISNMSKEEADIAMSFAQIARKNQAKGVVDITGTPIVTGVNGEPFCFPESLESDIAPEKDEELRCLRELNDRLLQFLIEQDPNPAEPKWWHAYATLRRINPAK